MIDNLILLSLQKACQNEIKKRKVELEEGEYLIDETLTISIKGKLRQGPEHYCVPTVCFNVSQVAGLFLDKLKLPDKEAAEYVQEIIDQAINMRLNEDYHNEYQEKYEKLWNEKIQEIVMSKIKQKGYLSGDIKLNVST